MIRSFYYLPGEGVSLIEGIADFDKLSAVEGSQLWVDLCKPTDQESYVLTHDFKFHPLAIEDVISEKPRTKIDVITKKSSGRESFARSPCVVVISSPRAKRYASSWPMRHMVPASTETAVCRWVSPHKTRVGKSRPT